MISKIISKIKFQPNIIKPVNYNINSNGKWNINSTGKCVGDNYLCIHIFELVSVLFFFYIIVKQRHQSHI